MTTAIAPAKLVDQSQVRTFLGNNYKLIFGCHVPQVLLSGPAGTGKTSACLMKLHLACGQKPGIRCLIVRKTRASLTETALVTFEQEINRGPLRIEFSGVHRTNRHSYLYPNGSEIIIGGIDQPTRFGSAQYDLIYAQEAIELLEDDWEFLDSRLRNNRLAYQQLLADTNPSYPSHWLKRRCDSGKTLLLETRHEDNPAFFDATTGTWTERGRKYLMRLDALTGPRKQRLRFGRWVQAEGVVYEGWDAARHLIDWFDPPKSWARYISIDFGYTDPMVVQFWALDEDRRMYLYREFVQTGMLVEDMAREIKAAIHVDGVSPLAIICDHDAEGRATLERHLGRGTRGAIKETIPSIQAVAARLRVQGDGKPRLFVMRGSLVRRDPEMVERHEPIGLPEEMDSWCFQDNTRKEMPEQGGDHSQDACRYLTWALDKPRHLSWKLERF